MRACLMCAMPSPSTDEGSVLEALLDENDHEN